MSIIKMLCSPLFAEIKYETTHYLQLFFYLLYSAIFFHGCLDSEIAKYNYMYLT